MDKTSKGNSSEIDIKKKFELAKECIDSERFDDAVTVLNELIQLKPDAGQAYVMLGNIHYKLGRVDDALAFFEKAIGINPKLASAMVMLGNLYNESGDSDRAIEYYDSALAQNPKLLKTQIKASKIDIDAERLDEAEKRCHEAIKYNPQLVMARLMLANIYLKKGNLSAAEEECRTIITINGKVVAARLMMGKICMRQKKFAEAEEVIGSAIKLNPEAGLASLHLMHGLASFALNNVKSAELAFIRALNENNGFTMARTMLIKCYIQQERYQLGVEEVRKLSKDKGQGKGKARPMLIHRLLGEIYCGMGEYRLAVEEYNAAINNAPKLLEKFHELGEINKVYKDDKSRAEAYKAAFEQIMASREQGKGSSSRRGQAGGQRQGGRRKQAVRRRSA